MVVVLSPSSAGDMDCATRKLNQAENDEDENRERWNKGRKEETSGEITMTTAALSSLKFLATGV